MSIIRRHHCPHTTKDRCRRVLLGREGGGSGGGGHFGGMVVSSQAATASSFCDRVHFRPVLRVGFTKTSLGMYFCISCACTCDSARRSRAHFVVSFLFLLLRSRALSTRPEGWIYQDEFRYILLYLLCTHAIPHVAHTKLCVFSFPKNA